MLILVVTELLIFGLFIVTAGRIFQARFEHYTRAKVMVARELVKEKIQSEPERRPAENEALKNLILFLGETYGAKVWLALTDGTTVVKSFPGNLPIEIAKQEDAHLGEITNYRHFIKDWMSYAVIPVEIGKDQMGSLHIIFETMEADHIKAVFAIGLAVIGLIVALLVYSVSRRITAPIKQLKDSTLRIAEGDLSHRAGVKSRDEIGDLGRSFNYMTEKLEKMIRSGRELTAHVSHELRSPLARIRVAEELLKDCIKRGNYNDLKRHFNAMEQDIEELDRLIARILKFSKLDIQQRSLNHDRFNLADLLNELLSRSKSIIGRKRLRITTDLSTDAYISGDKESLGTAFSNIIDNAIKFTPENGGVVIKLQTERGWVDIKTINDSNPLSKTDLDQIFKPFYRVKDTPDTGYGLGLAIVKKIIEMHGGTIDACNPENCFEIRVRFPADG
jgi:two-component system sensor histidine kinase CpxA